MTTQYKSGQGASFSLLGFLLALLMGAALLAIFVHRARTGLPGRLATLLTGRTSTFDASVPVVVEHIQSLNRLENTGILVPADANLESDTRAKAQQQLQAAALSDGILDVARKNARASIALLLSSLGFDHVDVT
jgi:hypothetical protein